MGNPKLWIDKIAPGFPHRKIWWIILYIISICSIIDLPAAPKYDFAVWQQWVATLGLAGLKAGLITIMTGWVWKVKQLRPLWILCGIFYITTSIVNILSWYFFGFGICRKFFRLISQTNSREISEFFEYSGSILIDFFSKASSWWDILLIAIGITAMFYIPKKYLKYISAATGLCGAITAVWIFIHYSFGKSDMSMILRVGKYMIEQRANDREVEKMINSKPAFPNPEKVRSTHRSADIVIMFGETASRNYLSIYGYPIKTSPRMDSLRDSLFVFTDAIGSSQDTQPNMERILSFKRDDKTEGDWYKYPSMIDLFNLAGYRTYWYSNQERAGTWASAVIALVSGAYDINYVGMEYCEDAIYADTSYDDKLLVPYRKAYSDSASGKLIMMHLQGSHFVFNHRYPSDRNKIKAEDVKRLTQREWLSEQGAKLLAEYANSMIYTDSIWYEVEQTLSRSQRPSILIYLSDHGEKVCENGSNKNIRDGKAVEVPFVVYVNEAYRRANPDIIRKLREYRGRSFSTSGLVHILMTLSGTMHPLYNAADDPLSEGYVKRDRYVDGVNFDKN